MIICVDFDGTCVSHEYPKVGREIGATNVLKKIVSAGHDIILHTMRSGDTLEDAVQWFKDLDIPLYGINENPDQKNWTSSPKPFAHLYIDNDALGCPLKKGKEDRPYVDWAVVNQILVERWIIQP